MPGFLAITVVACFGDRARGYDLSLGTHKHHNLGEVDDCSFFFVRKGLIFISSTNDTPSLSKKIVRIACLPTVLRQPINGSGPQACGCLDNMVPLEYVISRNVQSAVDKDESAPGEDYQRIQLYCAAAATALATESR